MFGLSPAFALKATFWGAFLQDYVRQGLFIFIYLLLVVVFFGKASYS